MGEVDQWMNSCWLPSRVLRLAGRRRARHGLRAHQLEHPARSRPQSGVGLGHGQHRQGRHRHRLGHLPLAVPQHRPPTGPPTRHPGMCGCGGRGHGALAGQRRHAAPDPGRHADSRRHPHPRAVQHPSRHRPQGVQRRRPRSRPHAALRFARGRSLRRGRWRDQRADRRMGPYRHPLPASSRPVAPLRGRLREHGGGRRRDGCRGIDPRGGR